MTTFLATIYTLAASGIAVFGLLGLFTLFVYWRHKDEKFPCPEVPVEALPKVTVQLPIYNERYVVDRLVKSAVSLDYPQDKLQIQIVDDSTDDTADLAAQLADRYRKIGVNIVHNHRTDRVGYKAGALQESLEDVTGDYIAVFDADFQPDPSFLKYTVPHFVNDPELGMVQARWGHMNDTKSALTAAQAIALDKHFVIEQTTRHRANFFPKFNGSGGVWRRECIEDAGGWEIDTVCEDLCLSTRAVLKGWQFRFLDDVVAPAELPQSLSAYKNQQARWAKGSLQCLFKYWREILTDEQTSLNGRIYALLTMSAYAVHVLIMTMLVTLMPLLLSGYQFPVAFYLFSIAGVGQPLLFLMGQQLIYPDWKRRLRFFPALIIISIGIGPMIIRAIIQSILSKDHKDHPFIRTPKGKLGGYQLPFDSIILAEVGLALYALGTFFVAIMTDNVGAVTLPLICLAGYGMVALGSYLELVRLDQS